MSAEVVTYYLICIILHLQWRIYYYTLIERCIIVSNVTVRLFTNYQAILQIRMTLKKFIFV